MVTHKKTYSRKKTKKNINSNINSNIQTQNGGNIINTFGKYVYQPVKAKDYKAYFPGEKLIKSFTNKESPEGIMTAIFKYNRMTNNSINLDSIGKTVLNTTDIEKEPYIKLKYYKKCLVMMYENIKNNKKKIFWIAEYNNGSKAKSIFHYKSPKLKNGRIHSLIIELYVYPYQDISQSNVIPSLKLSDKASYNRKLAYVEFLQYMIINKLKSIPGARKIFNAQYKLDVSGQNIFSMLTSQSSIKSREMFKYNNAEQKKIIKNSKEQKQHEQAQSINVKFKA